MSHENQADIFTKWLFYIILISTIIYVGVVFIFVL